MRSTTSLAPAGQAVQPRGAETALRDGAMPARAVTEPSRTRLAMVDRCPQSPYTPDGGSRALARGALPAVTHADVGNAVETHDPLLQVGERLIVEGGLQGSQRCVDLRSWPPAAFPVLVERLTHQLSLVRPEQPGGDR